MDTVEQIQTQLKQLAANGHQLSRNGFQYFDTDRTISGSTDWDIDCINRAMAEIPLIFKTTKNINKKNCSYGMKHVVERYRREKDRTQNSYISNGEFILAALLIGHKIKVEQNSPNCYFNMKV